ncbi:Uncharacterised protein [Mycobacteroides abscessus subsp. abscessus]|nr:Uncharacterised protein [Mycobacteroides abscessus subsp. abscessus]
MLRERLSASAMEHRPHVSFCTLVMVVPWSVIGELSIARVSGMLCCWAAITANTLNAEPVCNGACAKS